jgi:hypothetical protein
MVGLPTHQGYSGEWETETIHLGNTTSFLWLIFDPPAKVVRSAGKENQRRSMTNQMTAEQYLSFLSGQITSLLHICTALIAMHPDRLLITHLVKKIPTYLIEEASLEHYKNGMTQVAEELETLVTAAVAVEQNALQVPGKDN